MNSSTPNGSIERNCVPALLLVTFLSACTVGPDYRRPTVEAPKAWRFGVTEAQQVSNVVWWDQFHDAALSNLVRAALKNNLDLEIAAANVDQAAAQYGITRSAQFPQVNAGATASRERFSQNTVLGSPEGGHPFNDYGVNLSASFELDVWGKLRRATESARASLLASEEGRRTVVLTVVSTVADGYIQLRALDRQLEIAQHTARTLGEAARLQRVRFEEGAVPESETTGRLNRSTKPPLLRCQSSNARSPARRISSACCWAPTPATSSAGSASTSWSFPTCLTPSLLPCWSAGPTSSRPSKI
jgi:multidrug efflux system outer membrane protein